MLGKIKNFLFGKQEPQQVTEEITKEQLKEWFEDKVKHLESEVEQKLSEMRGKLKEKIDETKESLTELENAELRNPNIPVREKQFMEGNRKAYLQRTEHLLREITDILEYETSFFLHHYKEYLDNFAKSTSRAYRILQQFFAKETNFIAGKLKEIDSHIQQTIADQDIQNHSRVEHIKKEFISFENKIKKKEELEKEIAQLKKELASIKKKLQELKTQKEEILSSKEYQSLQSLQKKKEEVNNQLNTLKNDLRSAFSSLDRPLKKYQRIAFQDQKLTEYYIMDPLAALTTDFSFKIVDILKRVSENIKDGKIELKEKQAKKIMSHMQSLNKTYFSSIMKKHKDLTEKLSAIEEKLKEIAIQQEFDSVNHKVENTTEKKKRISQSLEIAKQEHDSINLDHIREKLKADIEKLLRVSITFSEK